MEDVIQEPLVLNRTLAVAPAKVWRAWTDPDALRVWFGQAHSPFWAAELDVRRGGRYRFVLRESADARYEVDGVFQEVVPERRLVFTWIQRGSAFDGECLISVDLQPAGQGTRLSFTLAPVFDPRSPDAWRADFKRLARLLQTD